MTNYTLRFPRRMSEIKPYMTGPVEPMPDHRKGTIRGVLLAVFVGAWLAWALMTWAMQ